MAKKPEENVESVKFYMFAEWTGGFCHSALDWAEENGVPAASLEHLRECALLDDNASPVWVVRELGKHVSVLTPKM